MAPLRRYLMPIKKRLPAGTFFLKANKSKGYYVMINKRLGLIYKLKLTPDQKYWIVEEYPLSGGLSGCGCE